MCTPHCRCLRCSTWIITASRIQHGISVRVGWLVAIRAVSLESATLICAHWFPELSRDCTQVSEWMITLSGHQLLIEFQSVIRGTTFHTLIPFLLTIEHCFLACSISTFMLNIVGFGWLAQVHWWYNRRRMMSPMLRGKLRTILVCMNTFGWIQHELLLSSEFVVYSVCNSDRVSIFHYPIKYWSSFRAQLHGFSCLNGAILNSLFCALYCYYKNRYSFSLVLCSQVLLAEKAATKRKLEFCIFVFVHNFHHKPPTD